MKGSTLALFINMDGRRKGHQTLFLFGQKVDYEALKEPVASLQFFSLISEVFSKLSRMCLGVTMDEPAMKWSSYSPYSVYSDRYNCRTTNLLVYWAYFKDFSHTLSKSVPA